MGEEEKLTLTNLYKFRGRVDEFRRPVVAYLDFPWISGREFVLEAGALPRGRDVVPVR